MTITPHLAGTGVTMTFILDGPDAGAVADRLASVLHETSAALPGAALTVAGPAVVIDVVARDVLVDGVPVRLTRREFDLLLYLVRHPDTAFTRLQLLQAVRAHESSGERSIDVHVRRLRIKLGRYGGELMTLHGYGYRLRGGHRFTVRQ